MSDPPVPHQATQVPSALRGSADRPRLAIVIPALDEQETIGQVVEALPRQVVGVASVDVVVVDDGSDDLTARRASAAGADCVVQHARNRGLAAAFARGTSEALKRGADVVVTMDADGQHDPSLVSSLAHPVLSGEADVVVGVRPLGDPGQGSPVRRLGNRFGSWAACRALGVDVSDVTSGFRAFSREALLRVNVISGYTYTLETLIQAARKRLAVVEVPARARSRAVGSSRMTKSIPRYIARTGGQAIRTLLHDRPLSAFGRAAACLGGLSVVAVAWFLFGYARGGMHLPALLAAVLLAVGASVLLICGLLADGISANRRLMEEVLYRVRSIELDHASLPSSREPLPDPARWAKSA